MKTMDMHKKEPVPVLRTAKKMSVERAQQIIEEQRPVLDALVPFDGPVEKEDTTTVGR